VVNGLLKLFHHRDTEFAPRHREQRNQGTTKWRPLDSSWRRKIYRRI